MTRILQNGLHKRINAVKDDKVIAQVEFNADGVYVTDNEDVIKALTDYGYLAEKEVKPLPPTKKKAEKEVK